MKIHGSTALYILLDGMPWLAPTGYVEIDRALSKEGDSFERTRVSSSLAYTTSGGGASVMYY